MLDGIVKYATILDELIGYFKTTTECMRPLGRPKCRWVYILPTRPHGVTTAETNIHNGKKLVFYKMLYTKLQVCH